MPITSRRLPAIFSNGPIQFGILLVLAAAFRFYALDRYGLWLDETIQYRGSTLQIGKLYSGLFNQELFLSFIVGKILHTLGIPDSIWWLRFPHAIFGVLTVGTVWILANELFGKPAAWMSGVVAATLPVLILYSQEYRAYSLFALLSCVGWWTVIIALRRRRTEWWMAFSGITILSLYNHHVAVLGIISQGFFAIGSIVSGGFRSSKSGDRASLQESRNDAVAFFATVVAIAIAYIPILPFLVQMLWAESTSGSLRTLSISFEHFRLIFGTYPGFGSTSLQYVIWTFALIGLLSALRKNRSGAFAVLAAIVFPLVGFSISGGSRVLLSERYVVFIYPLFSILIGVGISAVAGYIPTLVLRKAQTESTSLLSFRNPGNALALASAAYLLLIMPTLLNLYATNNKPQSKDIDLAYEKVITEITSNDILLQGSTERGGEISYYQYFDSYYLRSSIRPTVFAKGLLSVDNMLSEIPRYLKSDGRLFVILSVAEGEELRISKLFEGRFEVTHYLGVSVLVEPIAEKRPMQHQLQDLVTTGASFILDEDPQPLVDALRTD